MRALEEQTRVYNFERDVLELCRGQNLSKVVAAINSGSIKVDGAPFGEIFYLIFELADGDIRQKAVLTDRFDAAWTMRSLHQIAVGVSQLHGHGIFHQDIKPSNILVFEAQDTSKLADLGRSHCRTIEAPHDGLSIPGARSYAPPEQLYNYHMEDGLAARASADLYSLGSMVYFLFTGVMLTPSVASRLRPEHRAPALSQDDGGWRGYFEDVLPYLRAAYGEVVSGFRDEIGARFAAAGEPGVVDEVTALLTYLTDPDPWARGHPRERALKHGDPFSLRRFISSFDRISLRLEYRFQRSYAEAS